MAKEYIEREMAIETLYYNADETCSAVVSDFEAIPAADVAEVVHGEWEGYTYGKYYGMDKHGEPIYCDGVLYYCSECQRRSIICEKYCPNCGAKMQGGEEK